MPCSRSHCMFFFFFNDTATTEIYTLSLHDALPICLGQRLGRAHALQHLGGAAAGLAAAGQLQGSEEHTSELQSPDHLVCRLLLEKKKKTSARSLRRRVWLVPSTCHVPISLQSLYPS